MLKKFFNLHRSNECNKDSVSVNTFYNSKRKYKEQYANQQIIVIPVASRTHKRRREKRNEGKKEKKCIKEKTSIFNYLDDRWGKLKVH